MLLRQLNPIGVSAKYGDEETTHLWWFIYKIASASRSTPWSLTSAYSNGSQGKMHKKFMQTKLVRNNQNPLKI